MLIDRLERVRPDTEAEGRALDLFGARRILYDPNLLDDGRHRELD
jgi:hypothetical protein